MRVIIDDEKCQGHGRCYSLEPALFDPKDDLGHSSFIGDGVSGGGELPDDRAVLQRLIRAADACPERAITLESPGTPENAGDPS